jgi:fatty-acyl-CoA synthase
MLVQDTRGNSHAAPSRQPAPLEPWTVGSLLEESANDAGDEVAIVAVESTGAKRCWTYGELNAEAERTARALLARFEPGERVAIWAPNVPEWLLLQLGAALARMTLVTVNPAYRVGELTYVLRQSRASGIFFTPEYRGTPMAAFVAEARQEAPELRECVSLAEWDAFRSSFTSGPLPHVSPEDIAQIQYTSGTTGFPKGALLHHRGITNNARYIAERNGVTRGAVWLNQMPLFHVAGSQINVLGAIWMRARQVLCNFEPGLVLRLIEQEGVELMLGAPTMYRMMLDHPAFSSQRLSTLRLVCAGGMVVPPQLVRTFEQQLNIRFTTVYGMTETCGISVQTSVDDDIEDKAHTVGWPLPHVEVRISDPLSGAPVAPGELGEVCVRGYLVMSGYFEMPDATRSTIDSEGWLRSGDLGRMDSRGYLTIEGRVREMIIRGGENIYPREIEEVLSSHPAVAAIAIVGLPDEVYGEQVGAFVRLRAEHTARAEELTTFCRQHLAPYKTPKTWEFVEELPLTASGKVQKFLLREQWISNHGCKRN